jgi:hypothetical protein
LSRCGSASPGARRICGCTDPTYGHETWSPCPARYQGVGWLLHEEIIHPVSPSCGSCCCSFTFVVLPAYGHTQGSAHVRHPPGEDRSPSGPACTQDPGRTSAASSVTGKTLPCTPLHKSSRSFRTSARALYQPGEVSASSPQQRNAEHASSNAPLAGYPIAARHIVNGAAWFWRTQSLGEPYLIPGSWGP